MHMKRTPGLLELVLVGCSSPHSCQARSHVKHVPQPTLIRTGAFGVHRRVKLGCSSDESESPRHREQFAPNEGGMRTG